MGPNEDCLALADYLLKTLPEIKVGRIELAYAIQAWSEIEDPT